VGAALLLRSVRLGRQLQLLNMATLEPCPCLHRSLKETLALLLSSNVNSHFCHSLTGSSSNSSSSSSKNKSPSSPLLLTKEA
jgi:hypothetical protein